MLLAGHSRNQEFLQRVPIKASGRVFFIPVIQIDWIDAESNYSRLYVGLESYVIRETITNLEMKLDPRQFVRIHRSTIVNADRIREMQLWRSGDYKVVLEDTTVLNVTPRYKKRLQEVLGKPIKLLHSRSRSITMEVSDLRTISSN